MRSGWREELWTGAGFALLVAIGGVVFRNLTVFLLAGSLLYLAWHGYNLGRLIRWLGEGKGIPPPPFRGVWADLLRYILRLQQRSRKRKRKMSRFYRRFREATAALPDAAVILGRNGEIEWANPAARQLLDLGWPESAGHVVTRLVRDPALVEYLERGEYSHPLEMPSPADESRYLSCHVTRFGKKYQRLMVARDITRAHLLDQVRRDFVANVSHELRTPLTVLRGFIETMEEAHDECPEWARSVELMGQQAVRMERIVNDLLVLSRLELGNHLPGNDPVAVPEVLSAIVEEARVLSGEQHHHLTLSSDPQLGLRGNADELRSAFSNIIFNAVQHTPPGSEVRVSWFGDEAGAHLAVADSGEGISARHLPRLTERFYRVDKARSRQRGGTGLGLAIVKHVLTRHGGELHIASELGKGSTFTCHFPPSAMVGAARPADVGG